VVQAAGEVETFDAAWDFGSGASCADVGVTEVDLDWLNLRTNLSDGATFPCTAYEGTSPPLLDDDYTVALRAYTSASSTTPLSTADYGGAVYSILLEPPHSCPRLRSLSTTRRARVAWAFPHSLLAPVPREGRSVVAYPPRWRFRIRPTKCRLG